MDFRFMSDYRWQLEALNDRLMNRQKYVDACENVDAVVDKIQRRLMNYENCHAKVSK